GAYDPATDAMMAYDGTVVWKLPLADPPGWSVANPPAAAIPLPRSLDVLVYDSLRHRWLVFGGTGAHFGLQDTWALDVSSGVPHWQRIDATGPLPPPRVEYSAIYDALRDRLVIFGGITPQNFGQTYLNDVWALSLSGIPAWTQLSPAGTGPNGVESPQAVYDPVGDQMV